MISDGTYTEFECALSCDKHFLNEPITLPCGDSACKSCILTKKEAKFECNYCKKLINKTNLYDTESKNIKKGLMRNLESLFLIIEKQSVNALNELKCKYLL